MKKFVWAALAAVCVLAGSQQRASAWVNARFGIGLSLGWQCGNNNFLWGAWHNGQVPGPEAFGYGPGYYSPLQQFYPSYSSHHGVAQAPPAAPAQPYSPPIHFATYPREVQYAPPVYYYYGR